MVSGNKTIGLTNDNHTVMDKEPNDNDKDKENAKENDNQNVNETSSSSNDEDDIYSQIMDLYN